MLVLDKITKAENIIHIRRLTFNDKNFILLEGITI